MFSDTNLGDTIVVLQQRNPDIFSSLCASYFSHV